jgi:hypothetical protein
MRTVILSLLLILPGACHGEAQPEAGDSRAIACGPLGASAPASCQMQVREEGGTLHVTVRRPDGGFRRLIWPKDGPIAAADGAEPLDVIPRAGHGVEARIDGWFYRLEAPGRAEDRR